MSGIRSTLDRFVHQIGDELVESFQLERLGRIVTRIVGAIRHTCIVGVQSSVSNRVRVIVEVVDDEVGDSHDPGSDALCTCSKE